MEERGPRGKGEERTRSCMNSSRVTGGFSGLQARGSPLRSRSRASLVEVQRGRLCKGPHSGSACGQGRRSRDWRLARGGARTSLATASPDNYLEVRSTSLPGARQRPDKRPVLARQVPFFRPKVSCTRPLLINNTHGRTVGQMSSASDPLHAHQHQAPDAVIIQQSHSGPE